MRGGIDAVHDGVLFLDSEWMLMPRGGVSLRQDGWNNLKSTGLEMTGGFSLAAPGSRFSIDASGHWLELQTAVKRASGAPVCRHSSRRASMVEACHGRCLTNGGRNQSTC